MLHRLLDPLVDGGPEALRDDAAGDLVDELVAGALGQRLDHDLGVAELAAPAGLLLVAVPSASFLADRLEVRHARLVKVDVHAEAALEPVDRDLDVDLAHSREELLARLRVTPQDERRVLLGEAPQRGADLLLVALRLRRDREAHHGLGEVDLRQLELAFRVEQQVTGRGLLQLRDGADVSLPELLRGVVVLALEDQQRAYALLRAGAGVHDSRIRGERPGEDAEEVDAARERVGDGLEDEGGGAGAVDIDRRRTLGRRGDALDEKVEQRGRAEVLRRDPARDREQLAPRDRVLERVRDFLSAELLALEVALHQALVGLHDRVEQLRAVLLDRVGHLFRDLDRPALALALGAGVRSHVQQVDDPGQLVLAADRQVDRDAALRQL